MSMVNINRTETLISGSINGKPFSVTYDEKKYALMKELELKASQVETMEDLRAIVAELEPLTKESYKEIVETACPYLFVNKHTNKFYLQFNNVLSSKAIPQALVDRILTSVEKKIDITPLIKCWIRFLRNVNYSDSKAVLFAQYINATYTDSKVASTLQREQGLSNEVAGALATTPQVAITLEGLIVGYKVSKEILHRYDLNEEEEVVTKSRYKKTVDPDTGLVTYAEPEFVEERLFEPAIQGTSGDEFWCVGSDINGTSYSKKGHHIRVGASHYLDNWEQVNCNDGQSCVKGLHMGGLNYIHGYQNDGTVTHNVLVDPMDIGAVCDIHSGDGAMRVRRYFVHSSFAGVNKNIYHSSKYAAMNDEEYKKSLEEVVNKTQMSKADMDKQLDEAMALA
jgi:hypothetical protein